MPILYSFRRCPYAMRARMALVASGCRVELREILLRNKPEAMLQASAKGTVPVLVLADGQVIDESREVCEWALQQADPYAWWQPLDPAARAQVGTWFERNDTEFKPWLDRYKYADRHPEQTQAYYRQQGEGFLAQLETVLQQGDYLLGHAASLADVAVFPFIRQFAGVDADWFAAAPYPRLQAWLQHWLESAVFTTVMTRYPLWQDGDSGPVFPSSAAA